MADRTRKQPKESPPAAEAAPEPAGVEATPVDSPAAGAATGHDAAGDEAPEPDAADGRAANGSGASESTDAAQAAAESGADGGAAEADPHAALRTELEAARQQAADNFDQFLRLQAEMENYKKRIIKEQSEAAKFSLLPLLRDLIGIKDNMERALESTRQTAPEGAEAILSGIEMVSKQMGDIFERYGMTPIEALHKAFDPTVHEAMGIKETNEVPENQVMEQVQAGYTLHGRVVRPSMVIVSKLPAAPPEEPGS